MTLNGKISELNRINKACIKLNFGILYLDSKQADDLAQV